jgi:hypothetical protein
MMLVWRFCEQNSGLARPAVGIDTKSTNVECRRAIVAKHANKNVAESGEHRIGISKEYANGSLVKCCLCCSKTLFDMEWC